MTPTPPRLAVSSNLNSAFLFRLPVRAFSWARAAVSAAALSCCTSAFAADSAAGDRQASRNVPEETIELSPFTVSADKDLGYLARNTLGGTRLDTPLADVASQVSVMTPEFLQDIAATSLEDAMRYSLNVETVDDYASLTAGGTALDGSIFNEDQRSRTRGLEQSTLTQDFFVSNVRQDSYNTERFTFASGPNAILFGLGSPAGLIDSGQKRARLEQKSLSLSFRLDSMESVRSTIDFNVPLVKNRLGARVVLLKDNENQFPKGSGKDDKRIYGAVTFRPFKRTDLRLSYEDVILDTLPARPILIRDGVTPWLEAGKPLFDNSGLTQSSGSTATTNRINALGLQRVFSRTPAQVVFASGATDPSVENIPMAWTNTVLTRGPEGGRVAPDNIPGSLADSTVFPWDVNYEGNATRNMARSHTARAILEQNLFDKVFVQIGYSEERKVQRVQSISGGVAVLTADANRFLPDGRTPNPNVGRYFFLNSGRSRGSYDVREREDLRVSVSTGLDLEKRGGRLKWLGRHRLSGIATREDAHSGSAGFNFKAVTPSAAAAGWGLAPGRPGDQDTGGLALRAYVDDPRNPNNRGIYSRQMSFDPFLDFTLPDGTTVSSFNHPVGGVGTSARRVLLESRLLALQGYWWKGRIITTLGWRTDRHRSTDFNLPGGTYQPPVDTVLNSPDFPDFTDDKTGGTRNQGIVVRPFKWLSFHYSKSATFSPGITGIDAYNNLIPGSHGEGLDRGFTLTPFGERIYFRVNFYENTSGPRGTGTYQSQIINISFGGLNNLEQSVRAAGAPPHPGGYNPVDREGNLLTYRVTSLQRSTGLEAELIANPTPTWRLSLSAAKSESEESDIGKSWIKFVHERAPVWVQYAGAPMINSPTQTVSGYFATLVNNINLMQQADGQKVEAGREWRVRATTRYSFREGWLKSVFIGGSYLWSSPNVVGYKNSQFPNAFPELGGAATILAPDITKPVRGNVQSSLDVFAGYGRKLYKGKIGWRVQLNVRNALDDDTLLVRQILSDGTPLQFNVPKPRLFILTNTFTY